MEPHAPAPFVLLHLRWLQLRRALPVYGLVLCAMAICAALWLLYKALVQDPTLRPYVAGAVPLIVWGLHQKRGDHDFLLRHVPQARLAMLLEYAALVLPVLIVSLLANAWALAAVLLAVLAFPWVPLVSASGVQAAWLRKWIPAHLFEWRSMVQNIYPWILLLWLAALVFCWLPVLPLLLLGAISIMACGAQEICEPRAMLLASAPDPGTLLRRKVLGGMRLLFLLEVPVLIGATVFQPQWWWVHLLFAAGQLALIGYAVVLKYANYHPNIRLEANGANVAVAALFSILPGLGIVPIIMFLSELRQARGNLNTYFHAHHR